jgi:hypothetical protein
MNTFLAWWPLLTGDISCMRMGRGRRLFWRSFGIWVGGLVRGLVRGMLCCGSMIEAWSLCFFAAEQWCDGLMVTGHV